MSASGSHQSQEEYSINLSYRVIRLELTRRHGLVAKLYGAIPWSWKAYHRGLQVYDAVDPGKPGFRIPCTNSLDSSYTRAYKSHCGDRYVYVHTYSTYIHTKQGFPPGVVSVFLTAAGVNGGVAGYCTFMMTAGVRRTARD